MDLRTRPSITPFYLLLFHLILRSESVTLSKCQKMMTSLSCPENHDNSRVVLSGLGEIANYIENMQNNLSKANASEKYIGGILSDLDSISRGVQNLTYLVQNMSYDDFSEFTKDEYLIEGEEHKTEKLNIALLCLWIELQTLTRNISQMSTVHNTGKIATELKFSDLTTQILYLQQHVQSSHQNITFLYERLNALESNLSALTADEKRRHLQSESLNLTKMHSDHAEKLTKLKSKIADKGHQDLGGKQSQSTLNSHINSIPQMNEDKNEKTLHELIALMEASNHRLLNLSQSLLRTESELENLKDDFSSRLTTLEAMSAPKRDLEATGAHNNGTVTSKRITRETCNGPRRHLVGNSCYYMPLVKETENGPTWWEARFICKDVLGPMADLVAIETEQEMDNIIIMIGNHFGGIEEFWIGGNDLDVEGQWKWIMTSELISESTYSNWGRVPYRSVTQNCMSMLRGFKWAAEPCFYQRHPVCELTFEAE